MGKRGPAAKGEFGDKSAVLSTRISAELRAALERSVQKTGLTLSREIEHRLRRTFSDDEKMESTFGTERNYRLMQMVALALRTAHNPQNFETDWLDDPIAFEIALRTANGVLEALRPAGGIPELDAFQKGASRHTPAQIWTEVQSADASLPLKDTGRAHRANLIKSALGGIADRPKIFGGTAKELRAQAAEISDTKFQKNNRRKK